MPVYLIVSQTPSGQDMRAIVAADLADAAQQIKAAVAQGLSVNGGAREQIQIGVLRLDATGTITPHADGSQASVQSTNDTQPAIVDLPTLTVSSVAQANTAIQAIRTKVNTLLSELRAAGVIAP